MSVSHIYQNIIRVSNEFFNKKRKRKRGQKKYPHINQISSASFGTSFGISNQIQFF